MLAHRVQQAGKVVRLRRHRHVGLVHRRLLHHRQHRRRHLDLLRAHLRVPAVVRERRRRDHQPPHHRRVLHRQPQRDAAAERIPQHVDLGAADPLEQRRHVIGDRLAADRSIAQRRTAVALQVDPDHLPRLREDRQQRLEHVDAAQAAVQDQQRLALAADLVVVVDALDRRAPAGLGGCGGRGRPSRLGRLGRGGRREGRGRQDGRTGQQGNQGWLEHWVPPLGLLLRRRSSPPEIDNSTCDYLAPVA